VRFAVVRKLLESKGYRLDRISGSHHIFVKAAMPHVNIPVHRNLVNHAYYRQAQKAP
jgi:predicted RNA binding protein YcfA (HicA-like mRNA interferase family)